MVSCNNSRLLVGLALEGSFCVQAESHAITGCNSDCGQRMIPGNDLNTLEKQQGQGQTGILPLPLQKLMLPFRLKRHSKHMRRADQKHMCKARAVRMFVYMF